MIYTETKKVEFHDIDANYNIKPGSILSFIQEAADNQLRTVNSNQTALTKAGKVLIVSRMHLKMIDRITWHDLLKIKTWVNIQKEYLIIRGYKVYNGEKCVAKASGSWCLVDRDTKKLIRSKDVGTDLYSENDFDCDIPDEKVVFPNDITYKYLGKRKVEFSDIDANYHINNTVYASIFYNYIPNCHKYTLKEVSIHYVNEAPFESVLDIYMSNTILNNDNTVTIYFYSMINGKKNAEIIYNVIPLS